MNHLHLSDSIHMDDISMTFNGQTSIEIISENLHGNPVLFDLSDDDAWELGYFILHTHSIVIDTMGYQEQYKFIPLKASSTEKSLIDSRSYYLWSTLTGTFRYFLGP
uniref:AlNc14C434G11614 protein n=1 Tax=Albugo laibachii Nc14 TaxID=890382 RepID=F0WZM2_9STRA|nr:AlNc14C434G11614 [Albugo laibachii Nc14]|eukprot:CCA26947.1 AlNc14C434G11614 [Albugo laibachii Nc14]